MKNSERKIKRVQICPQCKSSDIQTDFSNAGAVSVGHFANLKKCNDCKHTGTFFPTIPATRLKSPPPANKVKNRRTIDLSFAKGYFGIYTPFIGICLILVGLVSPDFVGIPSVIIGVALIIFWFLRKNKNKNL